MTEDHVGRMVRVYKRVLADTGSERDAMWATLSAHEGTAFSENPPLEGALLETARLFGVTAEAMLGPSRAMAVTEPRWVVMAVLRDYGCSLRAIGRIFRRERHTVRHGLLRLTGSARLRAAKRQVEEALRAEPQQVAA